MITVRPATVSDLDELARIDEEAFDDDAWSRSALAAELDAVGDTRVVLVAVDPELAVGFAILLVVADTADVQRLAVAPSHRGRGVGSDLLTALIASAEAAGCDEVLLEVAADNEPAALLYLRHGFVAISTRPRYYADGGDALVMRLQVARVAKA